MGFGNELSKMTPVEMLHLWVDRMNGKGFDFEKNTVDNKTKIIHDYLFFIKKKNVKHT